MTSTQRLSTLFVRCTGAFMILTSLASALSRVLSGPFLDGASGAARAAFVSVIAYVAYGVVGLLILLMNKPLGWLLVRGLDDKPAV